MTNQQCTETVHSSSRDYRGHQCRNKGKFLDQPRRTLGTEMVVIKVGELSAYDALMGIDRRETKREFLPLYGPVEPRWFCAQHSPSQKAAKQQAARVALEKKYDREARAVETYQALVNQLTELVELAPYAASVSHRRDHNGSYYANGVLLTGEAARKIIAFIEGHLAAE